MRTHDWDFIKKIINDFGQTEQNREISISRRTPGSWLQINIAPPKMLMVEEEQTVEITLPKSELKRLLKDETYRGLLTGGGDHD
jgi:hypothetical protein